jgi:hypothetical protein
MTGGSWPSFWMWGAQRKWRESGEIGNFGKCMDTNDTTDCRLDIIVGIHTNNVNAMSLHTADGCSIDGRGVLFSLISLAFNKS